MREAERVMSLKDIAKALGISVTTVSRALNGYDDVSADTRARVEAEAQRRGYRPNTFARRLKMGKIDAVGLVFPVRPAPLNNSVFFDMVAEISRELARHEIDLLLIADDEQADKHSYMRLVQSRRVDALIVAHTLENDPRLEPLLAAGFPFLTLGRSSLPQPYAWFDFDNYAGTRAATRYLIERGHRRIALLGEDNNQAFIVQRRCGYLDALRESGLSQAWLRRVPQTRRGGFQATLALLALPEPPTAIITDCNTHGDGAAMALAQAGRLTGDDRVSLVVYDGLPEDSIIDVPVAAVVQSTRQGVGRQVADMVRRLIAGDDVATLQVLWQPEFRPGETA
ncbi:substrate-binding domain-containing protein [Pluralibacter gergoviae]|uniref:Substrate-binding domain-containing protein n=2 Tax=Pluralibacter gergoviae TaxID=61647 RepID=A0AAW8HY11_PLUGE|nr:substrate-binding domain-containing protein [Pluralibacter gergoviae]MDQ2311966.1 substrate-binding domain-containing protein [Pluralibacter gergoviae]